MDDDGSQPVKVSLSLGAGVVGQAPATVQLGGQDVTRGLHGVDVRARQGEFPRVTLHLSILELERLDLEQPEVLIPDDTRQLLRRLGWTPPGDAPTSVAIARRVATHWREGARQWSDDAARSSVGHVLGIVLAALDGETDPNALGVAPGEDAEQIERLAAGEG